MSRKITFYYHQDNQRAVRWVKKITSYIEKHHADITISDINPHIVFVLGGDGTILEAARRYISLRPVIIGFNLGNVGFLASVRRPRDFLRAVEQIIQKKFVTTHRMMLTATVKRGGKPIFRADALNEISIQSLLGVVRLTVSIDDHPLQFIHGGGIMVSTPTGSTGYNLSAHGPIVTPDIHCLILTEILDHHIPTPPMMVKQTKTICITITEMRKLNILSLRATGESANVILMADNANLFVLEEGDSIELRKSPKTIKFAELEHGYFFKSLQEKFAYR